MLVETLAAIVLIILVLGVLESAARGPSRWLDRLGIKAIDSQVEPNGPEQTSEQRQCARIRDATMREHAGLIRLFKLPVPKPEKQD
jgi:hypothetical protein